MHLIYAILAILLVGLFSMNMHRSMHHTQNSMVVNEVVTQLTGAGYDVLDLIGRQPFDENTDESKQTPLTYPVIGNTGQLTPKADFGGCTALAVWTSGCDDLDDFDGLTIEVDVDGFQYETSIAVGYVDPLDPDSPSGGNSYAKEVTLTISNPYLLIGGQPMEVDLSRVYTYNRHTSSP
jgi:hypothetical protein